MSTHFLWDFAGLNLAQIILFPAECHTDVPPFSVAALRMLPLLVKHNKQ